MKPLSNAKFLYEASKIVCNYKQSIREADTYAEAEGTGKAAIGYLKCVDTYITALSCKENSDFVRELSVLQIEMEIEIYQALIDNAANNNEPAETVAILTDERDYLYNMIH